jgi:hypothetical protein
MRLDVDGNEVVRVLLVGDSPQSFFFCRQVLERHGCECRFAGSIDAVRDLLDLWPFDIVLSTHIVSGEATQGLVNLLEGSGASLFSSLRVEEGSWWLPILRFGKEYHGPALPPGDFAYVLEDLREQIQADITEQRILHEKRTGAH